TEVPPNFITMRAMSLYQSSAGPAEGCGPASRSRPRIRAGPEKADFRKRLAAREERNVQLRRLLATLGKEGNGVEQCSRRRRRSPHLNETVLMFDSFEQMHEASIHPHDCGSDERFACRNLDPKPPVKGAA